MKFRRLLIAVIVLVLVTGVAYKVWGMPHMGKDPKPTITSNAQAVTVEGKLLQTGPTNYQVANDPAKDVPVLITNAGDKSIQTELNKWIGKNVTIIGIDPLNPTSPQKALAILWINGKNVDTESHITDAYGPVKFAVLYPNLPSDVQTCLAKTAGQATLDGWKQDTKPLSQEQNAALLTCTPKSTAPPPTAALPSTTPTTK